MRCTHFFLVILSLVCFVSKPVVSYQTAVCKDRDAPVCVACNAFVDCSADDATDDVEVTIKYCSKGEFCNSGACNTTAPAEDVEEICSCNPDAVTTCANDPISADLMDGGGTSTPIPAFVDCRKQGPDGIGIGTGICPVGTVVNGGCYCKKDTATINPPMCTTDCLVYTNPDSEGCGFHFSCDTYPSGNDIYYYMYIEECSDTECMCPITYGGCPICESDSTLCVSTTPESSTSTASTTSSGASIETTSAGAPTATSSSGSSIKTTSSDDPTETTSPNPDDCPKCGRAPGNTEFDYVWCANPDDMVVVQCQPQGAVFSPDPYCTCNLPATSSSGSSIITSSDAPTKTTSSSSTPSLTTLQPTTTPNPDDCPKCGRAPGNTEFEYFWCANPDDVVVVQCQPPGAVFSPYPYCTCNLPSKLF